MIVAGMLAALCTGAYIALAFKDKRWYLIFWTVPLLVVMLFAASVELQKELYKGIIGREIIADLNEKFDCRPINETVRLPNWSAGNLNLPSAGPQPNP